MIDTAIDCIGCSDNVYNHMDYGLNMRDGKPRCWHAASATLADARDVPRDMRPPYLTLRLVMRPSCYTSPAFARVRPEALDEKGFWR